MDTENVRSSGQTGSSRRRLKSTRMTRNGPRAALVLGAEIKNYEFEERLTLRGWIVSPRRSMARSSVIFAARFSAVFAW